MVGILGPLQGETSSLSGGRFQRRHFLTHVYGAPQADILYGQPKCIGFNNVTV